MTPLAYAALLFALTLAACWRYPGDPPTKT